MLASICASDLHIKHSITVGHEMVDIVEQAGPAVTTVQPGDRPVVNVETFCGPCFSVNMAGSTTALPPTAARRWAVSLTVDRLNMFGFPMRIRG